MGVKDLTRSWEDNVARFANRVCVHDVGTQHDYTWAQVRARVDEFQRHLRHAGLGEGSRLALELSAGMDWIAMVWACWNEGVCWCPLPPNVPPHRRAEQQLFGQFHARFDGTLHTIDANAPLADPNAAYLVFTSGTTGVPKGVLVGWQGLPTLWDEQCRVFGLTHKDTSVWMLSPSFDASVSDVGVALHSGATLVVVPQKHWVHYRRWKEDMERFGVTHLDAPPSLLALWEKKPLPACLRVVIAGGEPTPPSLLKAWSGRVRWVNVYGPTETTVCSSAELRSPEDTRPTIGQPLKGVVYAIDGGDEGELLIGGDCVALGYWRNAELTAERFVIQHGQRWYKTGDWVRKDGQDYVYCGRMDRQIKRNGQLINLDEVEHVLSSGQWGQMVVIHTKGQLHAFYCATHEPHDIAHWASQRLPAWGVPRLHALPSFPLTQHNKIDRTQLESMV